MAGKTSQTQKGILLQVAQLGQPVLRQKTAKITSIKDRSIQKLIDDLTATVLDVSGVGIAAPQVYRPLQLFIMASHPNPRYPDAPVMAPTAIINPEIISRDPVIIRDWEGCLSVPGIRALVPRARKIEVSYLTRNGIREKTEYEGFLARIFQHEYDHLHGFVFLNRIENTGDIYSEKEYLRLIAKKTDPNNISG